jgi:hypothetical protein
LTFLAGQALPVAFFSAGQARRVPGFPVASTCLGLLVDRINSSINSTTEYQEFKVMTYQGPEDQSAPLQSTTRTLKRKLHISEPLAEAALLLSYCYRSAIAIGQ